MRIPKYWIRSTFDGLDQHGNPAEFVAWGWSSNSPEEARERGTKRAKSIFLRLSEGSLPYRGGQVTEDYDYLAAPPREEIIQSFTYTDLETPETLVTRNRYGALVLNSSSVLFVDIDLSPTPRPLGLVDSLKYSFSRKFREQRQLAHQLKAVNRIVDWSKSNPNSGFRLYQTRGGYRLLFTDKLYHPLSDEVRRIFQELQSDPLYRRLTERQECFRARLTPKPWRIGLSRPNTQYPRDSENQRNFASWLSKYESNSKSYATCTYLEHLGPKSINHDQIATTLQLHDSQTKAAQKLSLA
ncbi:hypothetical protein [Pelagicoccus sp. SDUM812005]|uniref:hypothetical protein n=1 Tax=Pelagicoccus sp. SDUM812005 TaxID=3041257 RepID=UPI00280E803F|nr:hypothetical protein [Pelagicoccus sp. SDUM812005]MDQ8183798.1 hypothetical protein [Pelagicoccus sp. SDUM812005]